MPIAPALLRSRVVELRLLVALGCQHQVVEAIAVAEAAEQVEHLLELAPLRLARGVLHEVGVGEVAVEDDVAERRPFLVLRYKGVERRLQLRAALADGEGDPAFLAHDDVLADLDLRQHLGPQLGLVVIDHHERDQAGIEHVEQVLVLEVLVGLDQPQRGALLRREAAAESLEACPVAARVAYPDLLTGQVLDGGEFRRGRSRHHHLLHVLEVGLREVDLLLALRA